jgi:nitrate/nitrite transporter NarK
MLQIPSGWAADRWGTRGPLTIFAAAWTLAFGLMAGAGGWFALLALRFSCGAAQAGVFPCATRSIVEWLPASRRALASGLLGSCMSLGGAVANGMTGTLLERGVDWRTAFAVFVVPGVLWSIGFYAWFRDRPEEHPGVNQAELALIRAGRQALQGTEGPTPRAPTPWLVILASAPIWFLCGQQFFRAAGYVFYSSWFPTYLKETHGVTTQQAGWLSSLPLFAVVAGAPLGGWVADWLLTVTGSRRISRKGVGVASMLLSAAFVLPANWVGDARSAVLLISTGSFFASLGGPVAYTAAMDVGGRHVGTAFGMVNMAGNVGAAVFPVVAAELTTRSGSWELVLYAFCGVYVAAAVSWLCVDPDQVKSAGGEHETL